MGKSLAKRFEDLGREKMALWEKIKSRPDYRNTPEWVEIGKIDQELWKVKALLEAGPSDFEEEAE